MDDRRVGEKRDREECRIEVEGAEKRMLVMSILVNQYRHSIALPGSLGSGVGFWSEGRRWARTARVEWVEERGGNR
jgi:hypothetical protein